MSPYTTVLETPRLLLRRLVREDLDELFAFYSDPRITRYIPDAPRDLAETQKELEWFLNGHPANPALGLWATIHKESGRFIGRCGLLPWKIAGQEEIEVAFALSPAYWGQGLATEAARGILRYGVDVLRRSRFICLIDPENIASQRVAVKLGMTLEQALDGIDGDGIPTLIYALDRLQ